MKKEKMLIRFAALFIIGCLVWLFAPWQWLSNNQFINWDGFGYYQYLPSALIYHNFNYPQWSQQALLPYNSISVGGSMVYEVNHMVVCKYGVGVALLQLPFFLIAYLASLIFHFRVDGFSLPFQIGVYCSGLFYYCVGLFFSYKAAKHFFSKRAALFSVIIFAVGTNLFSFGIIMGQMSHAYGFCCVAAALFFTLELKKYYSFKNYLGLAIAISLLILVRPTNALVLIFIAGYLFSSFKTIFSTSNLFKVISVALIAFVLLSIQIAYWKMLTGHYFFNAYAANGERFNFLKPMIGRGLFSLTRGWLVYSPLVILSLLSLIILFGKEKKIALLILLFMAAWVYVVFSWWKVDYSGGMGSRAMIETYPLLILVLAGGLDWLKNQWQVWRFLVAAIAVIFIYFNIIQSWMLTVGLFSSDLKNVTTYWKSGTGITDFIEHKLIMKNNFQLKEDKVVYRRCFSDSNYVTKKDFYVSNIGNAAKMYQTIFSEKIKQLNLKNGDWVRVEGEGFYENRDGANGNNANLIFQIQQDAETLMWQNAPMPLNTYDSTATAIRKPLKFYCDFKIRNVNSPENKIEIYYWNDSPPKYWIRRIKISQLEIK